MLAPATAAPELSFTVPAILPVSTCATSGWTTRGKARTKRNKALNINLIRAFPFLTAPIPDSGLNGDQRTASIRRWQKPLPGEQAEMRAASGRSAVTQQFRPGLTSAELPLVLFWDWESFQELLGVCS